MKSRSLTVLLLQGNASEAAEFIEPKKLAGKMVDEHLLSVVSGQPWSLFVKKSKADPPRWADFFEDFLDRGILGSVSSAAAVLIVPQGAAWFAVTFGQGRFLLRQEVLVEDFGLRVTLNAVGDENVRSITKETFDAIANHSSQQSPHEAELGDFGLDVERDLLRAVMGVPRDRSLARRLSGRDALSITAAVDLHSLPPLLEKLSVLFADKSYKKTFSWVDNVRAVREAPVKEALDSALLAAIDEGNLESTWLAAPELLDWSAVRFFGYGERSAELVDVHWRTFLQSTRAKLSTGYLKRKKIYCFGEDGEILRRWSAYNCIYAELDYEGSAYLLTNGQWYKMARNLVEEIDEWYSSFPKTEYVLPTYAHDSEGDYNVAVSESSNGHYELLDQKFIHYGGAHGKLELCDLLGLDGELVHVKRYSGSREMSHLFMQGFVSGQLLRIDKKFRELLRKKVPARHYEACQLARDFVEGRRITFAVIYRSKGEFILPFFSKISLRQAARRLNGYDYGVSLSRIAMN